ncbi:hypothetical protein HK096_004553 [Nowakowskiella sp. JEL0078]|nr:hypothetical protein HK096_004553 [Nowakowskiella sp. JEL0078]
MEKVDTQRKPERQFQTDNNSSRVNSEDQLEKIVPKNSKEATKINDSSGLPTEKSRKQMSYISDLLSSTSSRKLSKSQIRDDESLSEKSNNNFDDFQDMNTVTDKSAYLKNNLSSNPDSTKQFLMDELTPSFLVQHTVILKICEGKVWWKKDTGTVIPKEEDNLIESVDKEVPDVDQWNEIFHSEDYFQHVEDHLIFLDIGKLLGDSRDPLWAETVFQLNSDRDGVRIFRARTPQEKIEIMNLVSQKATQTILRDENVPHEKISLSPEDLSRLLQEHTATCSNFENQINIMENLLLGSEKSFDQTKKLMNELDMFNQELSIELKQAQDQNIYLLKKVEAIEKSSKEATVKLEDLSLRLEARKGKIGARENILGNLGQRIHSTGDNGQRLEWERPAVATAAGAAIFAFIYGLFVRSPDKNAFSPKFVTLKYTFEHFNRVNKAWTSMSTIKLASTYEFLNKSSFDSPILPPYFEWIPYSIHPTNPKRDLFALTLYKMTTKITEWKIRYKQRSEKQSDQQSSDLLITEPQKQNAPNVTPAHQRLTRTKTLKVPSREIRNFVRSSPTSIHSKSSLKTLTMAPCVVPGGKSLEFIHQRSLSDDTIETRIDLFNGLFDDQNSLYLSIKTDLKQEKICQAYENHSNKRIDYFEHIPAINLDHDDLELISPSTMVNEGYDSVTGIQGC